MIRAAIWAAVSSRAQASSDKISLEHQVARASAEAGAHGWTLPLDPFIVPGESRTQYIDLQDAENDIPQLRAMLNAAQRRQYDVLIAYDTNRFRNLLKQVYWALADYGVQMYFVTQPVPIQPPAAYDPNNADTLLLIINVAAITSDSELAQIRRRYNAGMPKRVTERGLPVQIPWGYRRPQLLEPSRKALSNAVPEPDPAIVPHLLAIKDQLLAGKSTRQIIEYLSAHGVTSPRGTAWHPRSVIDILRNPFYAGQVRWGVSRVINDRRNQSTRRDRKTNPAQIQTATGQHQPLWDMETHQAIVQTIAGRARNYRGRQNTQFTGLLRCALCQSPLWRYGNGPRASNRLIWRCSHNTTGHITAQHDNLIDLVAAALLETLPAQTTTMLRASGNLRDTSPEELDALARKRQRLEDAYLAGAWSLDRYTRRKTELDAEETQILDRRAAHEQHSAARARLWRETAETLPTLLPILPTWLRQNDPAETNAWLRGLLDHITVAAGPTVLLHYRD
jgi:DNA invertase Pin-like site-specific DNA recombinase